MISLIIPTLELDDYLFENVRNYKLSFKYDYEIIIVYDIENKKQYKKYIENFKKYTNFKLIFNPNKGRIHALNLGYCHSRGDIIKCIDADDTLLAEFFENRIQMERFLAHCHNARLVNENKKTDQHNLWDNIERKRSAMGSSSTTDSMDGIYNYNSKIFLYYFKNIAILKLNFIIIFFI